MTRPWQVIDQALTDEGNMTLMKRGDDDFVIRMNHYILMSSSFHLSEAALGSMACRALGVRRAPRVLIAGLGMGFTLRAALDVLPAAASVTVAELNPVVVGWCRGPLAGLTGAVLEDKRVQVHVGDVAELISRAARDKGGYDAIALDLYQGTHDANDDKRHPIYGRSALERTLAALAGDGVFAVWTEEPDKNFEKRLGIVGFSVKRERPGRGGPRYVVYIARKTNRTSKRKDQRARR